MIARFDARGMRADVVYFEPVPLPAWLFMTLYGLLELTLGLLETDDGVAHFAHLGGMMGGWFLMQYWLDKLPPRDAAAGT